MLAKEMRKLAAAAGLMAMIAGPAMAQEKATTFEQLRVLVDSGDTVKVTDANGHEVKGTIKALSESELALRVGDSERRLAAAEIRTIRQRRDDSLANGARNGFAIGAVIGLLSGLAVYREVGDGWLLFATALYGGVGAGIGTGIDAMITHDRTIYVAPAKQVSVRVASW